jgi:hypothetical protein
VRVRDRRAAHPFFPCHDTRHHESEQDETSMTAPAGIDTSVAERALGDACSVTRPTVIEVVAPAVTARRMSVNEARARQNLLI